MLFREPGDFRKMEENHNQSVKINKEVSQGNIKNPNSTNINNNLNLKNLSYKKGLILRKKKKMFSSSERFISENYFLKTSLLNLDFFSSTKGCSCAQKDFLNSCEDLKNGNMEINGHSNGLANIIEFILKGLFNFIKKVTFDSSCIEVPEIKKTELKVWKNTLFCTEKLSLSYLDFVLVENNIECPKFYNKCGIADDYNNWLCIPEKIECPINQLKFLDEEVKENDNKLEKIFENESNISKSYLFVNNKKFNKKIDETEIKLKSNNNHIKNNIKNIFEFENNSKIAKEIEFKKQDIHSINPEKRIYANFKITVNTPCNESTIEENTFVDNNNILKLNSSEEKLLFSLTSANLTELYSNKKFQNFKTLSIKKNSNFKIKNGEFTYNPYFAFQNENEIMCKDDYSDVVFENKIPNDNSDTISIKTKKFKGLDKMQIKDFYFQNNLLYKIIDLPKFPKQNLFFKTTLYSQAYSGMHIICRDMLLNLINFDTENFIDYMKDLNSNYPQNIYIWIGVAFLFYVLTLEIFLIKYELNYLLSNPNKKFLNKANELEIKAFMYVKIFEVLTLFGILAYLRIFTNNLIFNPTNDSTTFNYNNLFQENKIQESQNTDCDKNINYRVFSQFYDNYYKVCFFNTIIYFISMFLIVHPIFKLWTEYTEDENEVININ